MARLPRLSVAGWPHLLIQRGHNGQPVFLDVADGSLLRHLLGEAAQSAGVTIHAYALLESELRLLATPAESDGLSRMMQSLGRRYGGSFNRRHGRTGSLWEGRFRATVVEPERHLLKCMRFIEEGTVSPADDSSKEALTFSSAAHHLGLSIDQLVSGHTQFWLLGNTPFEREAAYRRLLEQPLTPSERQELVDATRKAWPLGSESFVATLSAATERRLVPLPRGRPARSD